MTRFRNAGAVLKKLLLFATGIAGLAAPSSAQRPTRPRPMPASAAVTTALRGIWEPVSYGADVELNDVFFVTPDVGWVTSGTSYGKGAILHTRDGGASWEIQAGDPESSGSAWIGALRFIDGHHGWALQSTGVYTYNLLHTADGEQWRQTGAISFSYPLREYQFLSETQGVYLDGFSEIHLTGDGGRTWKKVFDCRTKLEVEGLTRDLQCSLKSLHFPTPAVGYAVGDAGGAPSHLFVAKTEDGGATWKLLTADILGARPFLRPIQAFFTSDAVGYVTADDSKLLQTTDGGQTWNGLVSTRATYLRFADPGVGWSIYSYKSYSYTTDGGRRWSSRELAAPATVRAFSLPRRDRAYVVGEHGMIYRYSVVPGTEPLPPKAIEAPAMPVFESPLDQQVNQLDVAMDTLEASVGAAGEATNDSTAVSADGTPSPFIAACCDKSLSAFQLILTAVSGTLPQFLSKYKNTNLLIVGLRLLTEFPERLAALKTAFSAFKGSKDKAAAEQALAELRAAADALEKSTAAALQKDVPAADSTGSAPGAGDALKGP